MPNVELDNFDQVKKTFLNEMLQKKNEIIAHFQTYNDGKWHTVEFAMSKNYATLNIDNEKAETR